MEVLAVVPVVLVAIELVGTTIVGVLLGSFVDEAMVATATLLPLLLLVVLMDLHIKWK